MATAKDILFRGSPQLPGFLISKTPIRTKELWLPTGTIKVPLAIFSINAAQRKALDQHVVAYMTQLSLACMDPAWPVWFRDMVEEGILASDHRQSLSSQRIYRHDILPAFRGDQPMNLTEVMVHYCLRFTRRSTDFEKKLLEAKCAWMGSPLTIKLHATNMAARPWGRALSDKGEDKKATPGNKDADSALGSFTSVSAPMADMEGNGCAPGTAPICTPFSPPSPLSITVATPPISPATAPTMADTVTWYPVRRIRLPAGGPATGAPRQTPKRDPVIYHVYKNGLVTVTHTFLANLEFTTSAVAMGMCADKTVIIEGQETKPTQQQQQPPPLAGKVVPDMSSPKMAAAEKSFLSSPFVEESDSESSSVAETDEMEPIPPTVPKKDSIQKQLVAGVKLAGWMMLGIFLVIVAVIVLFSAFRLAYVLILELVAWTQEMMRKN